MALVENFIVSKKQCLILKKKKTLLENSNFDLNKNLLSTGQDYEKMHT